MIPLGLTADQTRTLVATLCAPHPINVTVQVLDLNHQPLSDITHRLLDGQVNVDATADITRSCTLSYLDPRRSMSFDSDSPADGALYLDRMVRVIYGVGCPPPLGWVSIPVFTGPLVKMDRAGDVVNLEAQGKEVLAMGRVWSPYHAKRNAFKSDVIQELLRERAGETRFSFPDRGERLADDLDLGRTSVVLTESRRLAASMDRQLFWDGRGVARLRALPSTPGFVFRDGDGGSVKTVPQITFTSSDLRNFVWVKGGTPKGEKKAVQATLSAPASHPLSPYRLGRDIVVNGNTIRVPRRLVEEVDAGGIRSEKEARQVAERVLARLLLQQVEVAFDCLPFPLAEERDMMRLRTAEFEQPFRSTQFSLPLKTGSMSMGYLKRVSVKSRRNRRR